MFASSAMVAPQLETEFLIGEGSNLWRDSELFGVAVCSPEDEQGDIPDMRLDQDGKAAQAVIGAGESLDLGQKERRSALRRTAVHRQALDLWHRIGRPPDGGSGPA